MNKKMMIVVGVIICGLCSFALFPSLFSPNVDAMHEYDSISEFEKDTDLKFYDLYDFQKYCQGEEVLLSETTGYTLSFDEENSNSYSIFFDDNQGSYTIEKDFKKFPVSQYDVIDVNDMKLYSLKDDNRYEFIVTFDKIKYSFEYDDQESKLGFEKVLTKAKEYILKNNDLKVDNIKE